MSSSENDSDYSEEQLEDEQEEDSSDEDGGSEEEGADSDDADSEGEEQKEDDSDEGADSEDAGQKDDESDDEEDDSNDATMLSDLETRTDANDIKQKKKLKVSKAHVADESLGPKSKIQNGEAKEDVSGYQPLSLYVTDAQGVMFDKSIGAKIKELCPLASNVVVHRMRTNILVDFKSFEECREGHQILHNFQINRNKLRSIIFRISGKNSLEDRPSKSIFFSVPKNASIDEIMSHFPGALLLNFYYGSSPRTTDGAVVNFRTVEEAVMAKEKQIKIADATLSITFARKPAMGQFYEAQKKKWTPHFSGSQPHWAGLGNNQPRWAGHANRQPNWTGPANWQPNWAGPASRQPNWTGPANRQPNWAGPANRQPNWTGPANWQPNWSGPANRQPNWNGPANRQPNWAGPGNKRPHWAGPGYNQQIGPRTGRNDTENPGHMQKRKGNTENGENPEGPTRKFGNDEMSAIPAKKAKRNSEELSTKQMQYDPQATAKGEAKKIKSGKKEKALNAEQQLEQAPKKRKSKQTENGSNQEILKEVKMKTSKSKIKNNAEAKDDKLVKKRNSSQSSIVKEDKLSKVLKQVLNKEKKRTKQKAIG